MSDCAWLIIARGFASLLIIIVNHLANLEFEARLSAPLLLFRRWHLRFKHRSHSRSRSSEARRESRRSKIDSNTQPGVSTCPLSRKSFESRLFYFVSSIWCNYFLLSVMLSRRPRLRPTLDPVSTASSDSYSTKEIDDRYQHIQEQSGTICINGKVSFFTINNYDFIY